VAAVADLAAELDRGESEAIVLMGEIRADVLLMDERRGRASAARRGLPVTSTIGILRRARDHGHIVAVVPILEELRRRGFRIIVELMEQVRREEGGRDQG
jgi:predicted nucleic acid-binding protein